MLLRFSLTLLFAFLTSSAFAQVRGVPWWYDPYYPYSPYYPYYYPPPLPPPMIRRPAPPPEVQATPAPALPSTEPTYWYCFNTKQYYPETTQCPGGWQQVVPRSPPPPPPPQ